MIQLSPVFLIIFFTAVCASPCSMKDYELRYGECKDSHRSLTFAKVSSCDDGLTPPNFPPVSCECTSVDYKPVLSKCVGDMQTISYAKETDCEETDYKPPAPLKVPCGGACEDQRTVYTHCDYNQDPPVRTLVFYHNNEQCVEPPKAPVRGIPCQLACHPGEFLRPGEKSCSICPAGQYSIGGGSRHQLWDSWPDGFHTSCTLPLGGEAPHCPSGWRLQGNEIDSGDLKDVDGVVSELTVIAEFVRKGFVRFIYKVDAEAGYDGLSFYVDNELVLPLESYQLEFTPFYWPLEVGIHTLRWAYTKDTSESSGSDQASIKMIELIGTRFNDPDCSLCPPGKYSTPGKSACTECGMNEFSSTSGSSRCEPCSDDTYAFPGSSRCHPSPDCQESDYTVTYSPCDGSQRTQSYEWILPKICKGRTLPEPKQVPCGQCDPGTVRDVDVCKFCPEGHYSPGDAAGTKNECQACPAGTAAIKVRYIDNSFAPGPWPADWATGCESGYCGTGGWRRSGDHIDSGIGNGRSADVWVSLNVQLDSPGQVLFNYTVESRSGSLQLFVGSKEQRLPYVPALDRGKIRTFKTALEAGNHTLRWNYHKYSQHEDEHGVFDHASIYAIVITGVADGGAIECTTCPAGYRSNALSTSCEPCPAGTTSTAGSDTCQPCPANTFADSPGSAECEPCGHGTTSGIGSAMCSWQECRYEAQEGLAYYLGGLARFENMYGPVYDNKSMSYYLNVCSQQHTNHSCYDKSGEAIKSFACQQTNLKYAVSLGRNMAYRDYDPIDGGVIVDYTGGSDALCHIPRSTTITFICDMNAGKGEPEPESDDAFEDPKCHYSFVWRSLQACPLCTSAHYSYTLGECGATGTQVKSYYWDSSKSCHAGVSLPADEILACEVINVGKQTALIVVVVIVSVLVVLLGALLFLYIKNRRIYSRYTFLKEQNEADLELEKYTFESDDGN